ncbi:MAG: GTP-binding protein [Candidatus Lokiarchaeota archaeon]|nr:GTP-binding protein [Candidatus Lokiarchaeota archaeon]
MMRFVFKVVLLGSPAVGKTSLVIRFIQDRFKDEYITTLGADFLIKEVIFEELNIKVKLLIWDLGAQKRWADIRPTYLVGTDGAIIVFDLTRKRTFEEISEWLDDLNKYSHADEKVPYILVGNKNDLEEFELREVTKNAIDDYLSKNTVHYLSTSAKSGENVEKMFRVITLEILKQKADLERKRQYLKKNLSKIMDILDISDEIRED